MASMDSSLYQPGDYIFVETSSTTPYQIRRIEDFKLGADGTVEVKVTCVYRRTNLPPSLIALADSLHVGGAGDGVVVEEAAAGREGRLQRHLARQRELFPSRLTETVPVTRIRGRCFVSLLSGAEQPEDYLHTESSFFYSLLYEPAQRSLVADRGEIRVGAGYQTAAAADRPPLRPGDPDPERPRPLETALWTPGRLTDAEVDTFVRLARSVGTLARAVEPGGGGGRCGASLHLAAAAAGRGATVQHALDTLHAADYQLAAALSGLVGSGGGRLALCQDQLDAWTPAEAQLFEQAFSKCGKAFGAIRRDFLPWKSASQLVEYYYLRKTADRYLRRRRSKAVTAAGRPARVLLPAAWRWGEPSDADQPPPAGRGAVCAGCSAWRAARWFVWGWRRLCGACWLHWRRYGGLRRPATPDGGSSATRRRPPPPPPPATSRAGSGRQRRRPEAAAVGRGRALPPFLLRPPPLMLVARRLCAARLRLRRLARSPLRPVSGPATQAQCLQLLSELSEPELERLAAGPVTSVAAQRRRRHRPELLLAQRSGPPASPPPPPPPDDSVIPSPFCGPVQPRRCLSVEEAASLAESPALRVRRPSISQTPLRRSSASQ